MPATNGSISDEAEREPRPEAGRATDRQLQRLVLRRRSILDAAARSFAAEGYERVTLEEIGAEVGLSATSLYHYVDGKEDILAQLLGEAVDAIGRQVEEGRTRSDDPRGEFCRFVRAHLCVAATTPAGRVLTEHQDMLLRDTASDGLREARRRHAEHLEAVIGEGIDRGVFRPANAKTVVRLVLGALNGVARWYSLAAERGDSAVDAVADELVELLLAGIGSPVTAGPVSR